MSTPQWARASGLPEHDDLQYLRSLAAIALVVVLFLYVLGMAINNPRNIGKALRRRVLG